MTTPRMRTDLQAAPVEEDGLRFMDVTDPRAGTSMRLYEHEWLLALHMDGTMTLDELARWAEQHVGFRPSVGDLAAYARRLGDLGFFDEPVALEVGGAKPARPDESSFANVGEDVVQTADVRPDVLAAVRHGQVAEAIATIERAQASRSPDSTPTTPMALINDGARERVTKPSVEAVQRGGTPAAVAAQPPRAATPAVEVETPIEVESPVVVTTLATAKDPTPVPVKEPPVVRPERPTVRPVTTPPVDEVPETPERSRSGLVIAAMLLVVAVLGAVGYFKFLAPAMAPVRVSAPPVGSARDIIKYWDARGTVSRAEPVTLSFGVAGRVVDLVPVGAEAKPGMTLASLDTLAAMEKELADVRDREAFYEAALRTAQAKNKTTDARRAKSKIDEKKRLRTELEERITKARIVAPAAATVAEVLTSSGASVEAGAAVIKLADKRTMVTAKLGDAEAKALKPGAVVQLAVGPGGPMGAARIDAIEGGAAKMEVTDDAGGAIKNGVEVVLVQSTLPKVIRLPAAAVSKSQGGADQVFVVDNGVVKAHAVQIAERTATEVYLTAGVAAGERVVISSAKELSDGAQVAVE